MLQDYSDELLLAELLRRNPPSRGPNGGCRHQWPEAVLGIGKNHIAYVTIHKDDLDALKKMHPEFLSMICEAM